MIIVSLALPGIAGARRSAQRVRSLVEVRSNAAAIDAYCAASQDVFPFVEGDVNTAAIRYWRPLVDRGFLQSVAEADPVGIRRWKRVRYVMSMCMVYPATGMRPGSTLPAEFSHASAVRQQEVVSPSHKGLILQYFDYERGVYTHDFAWGVWERAWPTPIAMADGSGLIARCTDFRPEHMFTEGWVGVPVISTWNGCAGRDLRW